ncbi:hypothetical protein ACYJW8_02695 [Frateuria aurantia]
MRHSSQIKSINYLMNNAADVLAELPEEQAFLNNIGHGVAAHQNETAFGTHLETLALLRMMAARQQEARANGDITGTKTVTDEAA